MKLLIAYIKENRRFWGMTGLFAGVFFIIFALNHVSISIVLYPAFICLIFLLLYMATDFMGFVKRHKNLEQVKNHIDVTLENLPVPKTVIEEDYHLLLEELLQRKNESINNINSSQNDTIEYITLCSHQIKTPLTALELLAAECDEPMKTEFLARLFEVEQYADMMLQYMRLEGGSADYVLKEYSVKSMVNQAVKYYARIFISKKISVKIEIPEEEKAVTDEKWMVFVLKQLISNALKYTKQGSITVSMEQGKLCIKDTGIGIAPEDLPLIFERGYTGYNGRKDKKATGLGLFLVNRIMGQLHHKILIESEVNVGTKVIIFLKHCVES